MSADDDTRRARSFGAEVRASAGLAVPVVAVQLGTMLMGVVDTSMLGHLSAGALAASAIGYVINATLLMFGAGVLSALDPLVAQAFGAGDREAIARHVRRGLQLAVALAIPLSLLTLDVAPLLRAIGEPPGVIADGAVYTRALIPGNLFFLLFFALRQSLQAMRVVRPAIAAIVVGNLANAAANYGLIFGHWGLPALGVAGSAYATSAARVAMCLVLAAAAFRHRLPGLDRRPIRSGGALADHLQMARIGIPIGLHMALELALFLAIALLIGRFGNAMLAAHQIALSLASLSYTVPLGIAGAAATRVGNAIGAGDTPAARRTAAVCLGLGAAAMALFGVAFAWLPRPLAAIFTDDPAVIAAAAVLLPIAAVFQVFDGLQVVAAGVLRGTADTTIPAATALVGYWVVALPCGYVLAVAAHQGPRGLWWGVTLGLGVVGTALVARVVHRFRTTVARVEAA